MVSNEWPKMVVTPPTGSPLSSSLAENERNGCSNWVAWPQLSAGRALKICSPLISSMRKQSALTQWQTRTRAECRTTTRGTATGRAEDAEGMDAMAMAFAKGGALTSYGRAGRKFRQAGALAPSLERGFPNQQISNSWVVGFLRG